MKRNTCITYIFVVVNGNVNYDDNIGRHLQGYLLTCWTTTINQDDSTSS
jgi:hypothetical protein